VDSPILETRGTPEDEDGSYGVSSSRAAAPASEGEIERFRRVGHSLGLDVVGAVVPAHGTRRVTWWHAAGSPALPIRIDDVLEGRLQGWLACITPSGTVIARLTSSSSVDAAATLAEHAASLIAPKDGDGALEALDALLGVSKPSDEEVADRDHRASELALFERATGALRRSLGEAGTTRPDALEALRAAIGARELFVLAERGEQIDVYSPSGERTRDISPEMRASIRGIETGVPTDEATLRRIGVVLGLGSAHVSGAFARWDGRTEGIIAGWNEPPAANHRTMELLLSLAGCAGDGVEERGRAADLLMLRERARLAYELHDGVTQAVTQVVLELEMLGRRIGEDPRGAAETLAETKAEVRTALGALRALLFELSTEPASHAVASDPFADYVREVAARWNLASTVDVEGDLDAVPRPVLTTAWTVVREALINAAKHSGSGEAAVRATASASELSIEIEDHGRGFDPAADDRDGGHLGLHMMQTRVSELGGSIDIASSPEVGTRVVAHLPVRNRGETS
jgi:signal transduction histidine kinase